MDKNIQDVLSQSQAEFQKSTRSIQSPVKSKRRDLELDSFVGSHMKELSEQKKKDDENQKRFMER